MQTEQIFTKRKWDIPEDTFIELPASDKLCAKLNTWKNQGDFLIVGAGIGYLFVLNETKLNEWQSEKTKKEQSQKGQNHGNGI